MQLFDAVEAQSALLRASEAFPTLPESYLQLVFPCFLLDDVAGAETWLRKLLIWDPKSTNAYVGMLWVCCSRGDLAGAWESYDQRRSRMLAVNILPVAKEFMRDLTGKNVFLIREQGLGDHLFFLHFAPMLKARGARLTMCPEAKLRNIVAGLACMDQIYPESAPPRDYDASIPIGDLPRLLEITKPELIPPPLALKVEENWRRDIQSRTQHHYGRRLVGVTWEAGIADLHALHKVVPPLLLGQALRGIEAEVYCLQRNPRPEDMRDFATGLGRPCHNFSDLHDDLDHMLALLDIVEEYIAVSNTCTHMRAGLGKVCRVLIPAPAEWRWVGPWERSPWFPNFPIYRQQSNGDWSAALATLRNDLTTAGWMKA